MIWVSQAVLNFTQFLWDKGQMIAYSLYFDPNNQMSGEKSPSMFLQHQLLLPVAPCLKILQGGRLWWLPNASVSCCGLVCCLSGTITFQHVFVVFLLAELAGAIGYFSVLFPVWMLVLGLLVYINNSKLNMAGTVLWCWGQLAWNNSHTHY